jgi:hypothetical protein
VGGECWTSVTLSRLRASSAGSCSSSRPRWSRSDRNDLAEGEVGGGAGVVGEPVGAFQTGVAEPPGTGDAADDRPGAEPGQVALVPVGRGGFLVDGERLGDP